MKNLLIVVLLFCHYTAYFQSIDAKKRADSLSRELKSPCTDEERIFLYYKLSDCYFPDDADKINYYSKLILSLAQKNKSSIGLGLYHISQCNFYFTKRELKKSFDSSKKAYTLLQKTKDTKSYLTAIICLARSYSSLEEFDSLKKLLEGNSKLFHQFGDSKLLGDFYRHYAACFHLNIDKRETLCFKKALYYYDLCNDEQGKVVLYYRIATNYKKIKLNSESLKYLNLALDLNPGDYFKHILELEKAKICNKIGSFKEAKELSKKVQLYLVKMNNEETDIYWMSRLAEAKSNHGLKKQEEAIEICKQILSSNAMKVTIINTLNTISLCYLELGRQKEAKSYMDQSTALIDAMKNSTGDLAREEYFKVKAAVEGAIGNYKTAWLFNQKYIEYVNKTADKSEKEQFEQHQIQFEVADKEIQIKKLKIADLKKDLLLRKQYNYLLFSAFIVIISIILFVAFYVSYRTIKIKNKTIQENVEKLEKSLKEKELLLKEIHHRVKNNFQLVTSLLNIQSREADSKDLDAFVEKIQNRIISMSLIHENLYQTERLDKVNFQEYVKNLIENIKKSFHFHTHKIITNIEIPNCNFDIQTAIPLGLIINELYCNILKYSFPNNEGTISIELIKLDESEYQLIVLDNGIGMTEVKKNNKGIGVELVYLLAEQLNGNVDLINDNGTKYIIKFKEIIG